MAPPPNSSGHFDHVARYLLNQHFVSELEKMSKKSRGNGKIGRSLIKDRNKRVSSNAGRDGKGWVRVDLVSMLLCG